MRAIDLKELAESIINNYGEETLIVVREGRMGYVCHLDEEFEERGVNTYHGSNIPFCIELSLGSQIGMGTFPMGKRECSNYEDEDEAEEDDWYHCDNCHMSDKCPFDDEE